MIEPSGPLSYSPTVVGSVYLLTAGVLLLLILREPVRHLEKPGSKGFVVAIFATALWPLSHGLNMFVTGLDPSIAIWNVRLFAAALVSVGWFVLAYEFTIQRLPPRWMLALFLAYLLAGQLVAWTNPTHTLVLGPGTAVEAGVLVPEYGPWFTAQAAINYGLILVSTALLTTEWLSETGFRRQQSIVLASAVIPPIVANLVTLFGLIDTVYDLTPFGLIGTGIILSWALYRMNVLNTVTVGRKTAVDEMRDPVIIVSDDAVLDCNEAARDLLGVDAGSTGTTVEDFFASSRAAVVDRPDDAEGGWPELTVSVDGEQRHFSLSASSIESPTEESLGRVIVCRDVTLLKKREEELDLFRQILTRVLRHNLRTEVTMIRGYGEMLAEEGADERVENILESSDALLSTSEKIRHIDRILRADFDHETYDLREAIEEAADRVASVYPEVSIRIDGESGCRVQAVPGQTVAVYNLLENAAEHNDATEPRVVVSITPEDDVYTLTICDNGPGIPPAELAVLENRSETALSHGSGIGLWLVEWWANKAAVDPQFDVDDGGTTVTVSLPRLSEP